jgi:hypothetical protein
MQADGKEGCTYMEFVVRIKACFLGAEWQSYVACTVHAFGAFHGTLA